MGVCTWCQGGEYLGTQYEYIVLRFIQGLSRLVHPSVSSQLAMQKREALGQGLRD